MNTSFMVSWYELNNPQDEHSEIKKEKLFADPDYARSLQNH